MIFSFFFGFKVCLIVDPFYLGPIPWAEIFGLLDHADVKSRFLKFSNLEISLRSAGGGTGGVPNFDELVQFV